MTLRIAYIKDESTDPVRKPPTRKEQIARFAAVLERKWRRQNLDKAIEKNRARIDALGLTPLEIYHKLL